jgi:crossover junction endodeoxyribonuclease RusA
MTARLANPSALTLVLPWPPTTNTTGRSVGGKVLISRAGRAYRENVAAAVIAQGGRHLDGRLSLTVQAFPPDKRVRDLDNTLKATLDALCHAGVYDNDGQIDELYVKRRSVVPGGELSVTITKLYQVSGE